MINLKTLKLLIIEDHKSLLEAICQGFKMQGYTILQTDNGTEAISIIKEQQPDIVILDLLLPDMTGLKVLQASKEFNPKIAVIVITGFNLESLRQKSNNLGADYFFYKPVTLKTLRECVLEIANKPKV